MARPEHVKCENCIFYQGSGADPDDGWCYRYPPKVSDFQVRNALWHIHWAVAHTANIDETQIRDVSRELDPDDGDYDTCHPRVFGSISFCGEFRSQWSAP